MDKQRLRFEKTGRACYISHLDLMTTMQRAFARADLPLKYSEGFNPHPLISILLPLSVGTESLCELMDYRLREDAIPERLVERMNAALPEGIRVLETYEAERKSIQLKWLEIDGLLEYDTEKPTPEQLSEFFACPTIVIEKRTKRGQGQTDIRPAIQRIEFREDPEGIRLAARISAQEPTLNPELLVSALQQLCPALAPDFARFRRVETFDAEGKIFR